MYIVCLLYVYWDLPSFVSIKETHLRLYSEGIYMFIYVLIDTNHEKYMCTFNNVQSNEVTIIIHIHVHLEHVVISLN